MTSRIATVRARGQIMLLGLMGGLPVVYAITGAFIEPGKIPPGLAILGVALGLCAAAWRTARDEPATRMTFGAAVIAGPAAFTYLLSGMAWQIDMHMTFFAALAMATVLCDWRAIAAAAAAAALHHLVLNLALPAAIFPDGPSLGRVAFHGGVVVAQAGVLVWLADTITRALEAADTALADAEAANAETERLAETERERQQVEAERARRLDGLFETFAAKLGEVSQSIEDSSDALTSKAKELTGAITNANDQATTVAAAAEQGTVSVESVASATEELTATLQEVSGQVASSADAARASTEDASRASDSLDGLNNALQGVDEIIGSIQSVAEQTNLLALNATIEAARAGEAGKGFAVVASEVKQLAEQTQKLTEQINDHLSGISATAQDAVGATRGIIKRIEEIDSTSASLASAVEEQTSATGEIASSAQQAAEGAKEASASIAKVQSSVSGISSVADTVDQTASVLNSQSERLKSELDSFLAEVRAA